MKNALAARPEHHEIGREGWRTQDLTDVNPANQDCVREVLLLVFESVSNWPLC